jgi:hypothetical protein
MDDASAANLRALQLQATKLLAERDVAARLESMCDLIAAGAG